MTQTEQNSAVRTREKQRNSLTARVFKPGGSSLEEAAAYAERELIEAEARGAAEQRRKDAEGVYQTLNEDGRWSAVSQDEYLQAPYEGRRIIPANIYTTNKDRLSDLIEGMEVSVDVSTGEEDAGNRLFGTVTAVQENQGSKNDLILLVQEPEPNFTPADVAALEARIAELEQFIADLLETERTPDPSTPRIIDLAYTAFMRRAHGKNVDDGGPCDWFNDTRPQIIEQIGKLRAALTREGGV